MVKFYWKSQNVLNILAYPGYTIFTTLLKTVILLFTYFTGTSGQQSQDYGFYLGSTLDSIIGKLEELHAAKPEDIDAVFSKGREFFYKIWTLNYFFIQRASYHLKA